jgi:hypothetical protein
MKTFKLIIMTVLLLLFVAGLFLALLEVPVNIAGAIAHVAAIILLLTNYENDRRLNRVLEEERQRTQYYRKQLEAVNEKFYEYMSRGSEWRSPQDIRQLPKKEDELLT